MIEINQPECIYEHEDQTITFDQRVLFATKALDCGTDLKDTNIKHIISDIFDLDSLIQGLGRKRPIDKNDTVDFYIRNYNKKSLILFQNNLLKEYEPAKLFKKDYEAYCEKYGKYGYRNFKPKALYIDLKAEGKLTLNNLMYNKMLLDNRNINEMLILGYKLKVLEYLGSPANDKIQDIEFVGDKTKSKQKDKLLLFLENNVDKKLFKGKQKLLKEAFESAGLKDRTMGINLLNGKLKDEKIQYEIISSKENCHNDNHGKRYWIVQLKQ